MTELEKEAEEWLRKFLLCNDCKRKSHCIELNAYCEELVLKAYTDSAEPREKRIEELEEKISVLLSCKNCPENKGGYICQKEYENKCLAQKIQFIKELKEELTDLEKENAELKEKLEHRNCVDYSNHGSNIKLLKAKELLEKWVELFKPKHKTALPIPIWVKTEQFLKESE